MAGGRSPLSLTTSAVGDSCVLTVAGVLDATTYRPLREAIVTAALDEPAAVIIDVTELVVREDAAWTVFVNARWQTTEWPDTPMGVVCGHFQGRNALQRSGITRYVPVYGSIDVAIAELIGDDERRVRRRARAMLPATQSSARRSRVLAQQWLTAWSRTDFIHAVSVVAVELVEIALANTNVEFSFRLETSGSTVTVAVRYVGDEPPTGRHAIGGNILGLALLDATSRVWGGQTSSASNTVWAVLGPENRF